MQSLPFQVTLEVELPFHGEALTKFGDALEHPGIPAFKNTENITTAFHNSNHTAVLTMIMIMIMILPLVQRL